MRLAYAGNIYIFPGLKDLLMSNLCMNSVRVFYLYDVKITNYNPKLS